jgi:hypothetical protein
MTWGKLICNFVRALLLSVLSGDPLSLEMILRCHQRRHVALPLSQRQPDRYPVSDTVIFTYCFYRRTRALAQPYRLAQVAEYHRAGAPLFAGLQTSAEGYISPSRTCLLAKHHAIASRTAALVTLYRPFRILRCSDGIFQRRQLHQHKTTGVTIFRHKDHNQKRPSPCCFEKGFPVSKGLVRAKFGQPR